MLLAPYSFCIEIGDAFETWVVEIQIYIFKIDVRMLFTCCSNIVHILFTYYSHVVPGTSSYSFCIKSGDPLEKWVVEIYIYIFKRIETCCSHDVHIIFTCGSHIVHLLFTGCSEHFLVWFLYWNWRRFWYLDGWYLRRTGWWRKRCKSDLPKTESFETAKILNILNLTKSWIFWNWTL